MGRDVSEEGLSLREQAMQFLQHPDIHDAPRERKVLFLESKGIPSDEIHRLLDAPASGNDAPEIDVHAPDPQLTEPHAEPTTKPETDSAEPTSPPSAPSSELPTTGPPLAPDAGPSAAPPIITYPEFLVAAHRARARPTALLAQPLLLPALYTTAFLAASSYALSALALRPMHDALSAARTDLLATARRRLDELTARLEGAVSALPAVPASGRRGGGAGADADADADAGSEVSDPTELFHRDVGVQTLSTPPSPSTSESGRTPGGAAEAHGARLRALREHATALQDAGERGAAAERAAGEGVAELRRYLEGLALARRGGGAPGLAFGVVKERGREEDEVARVRAEIRSVKGVLLSARSFPGGVMGRARAFGSG